MLALPVYEHFQAYTACVLKKGFFSCILQDSFSLTFNVNIFFVLFCFFAWVVTKNHSWVDRTWSISPIIYAWIIALYPDQKGVPAQVPEVLTSRIIFAVLITAWGSRLTYNFYRKGGYEKGSEDYRWEHVQKYRVIGHPLVWPIFVFVFVSLIQHTLIWAFTLPVIFVPGDKINTVDIVTAGLFLVFLIIETVADQQQWDFHQVKQKKVACPPHLQEDVKRGFLTHGLFEYSRHPNVCGELGMWLSVFIASTPYKGVSDACCGIVVLVAIILGGLDLSESLSAKKYSQYKAFQKSTPMVVLLPCRTRETFRDKTN